MQDKIKGQIIAGAVFVIAIFILIGLVGYEFVTGEPLSVPGLNLEKILPPSSPQPTPSPARTPPSSRPAPAVAPSETPATPPPTTATPVTSPSPVINSISPNRGYAGSVINYVTISGNNFRAGATVELTKTGETNILGNGFVVQNSSEISKGYLDLRNKNIGSWNVVVKNSDGTSGILPGGFTILSQGVPPPPAPIPPPPPGTPPQPPPPPPPPAILKVIKTVINDDEGNATASNFTINVKLAGNHVTGSPASGVPQPGRSYTLNPGTYSVSENPVSGYSVSFSGDCSLSGEITLASNDNKTCTVINNDNPTQPEPDVSSINPNEVANNGVKTFNISGNNFRSGAIVMLKKSGEADILSTGGYSVSSNQISNISFDLSNKATGTWNVYVTNIDGTADTLSAGLKIVQAGTFATGWLMGSGTPVFNSLVTAPDDWYKDENPTDTPIVMTQVVRGQTNADQNSTTEARGEVLYKGFDFNIPNIAIINGICVHIDNVRTVVYANSNDIFGWKAKLSWDGGGNFTAENSHPMQIWNTNTPNGWAGYSFYFKDEVAESKPNEVPSSCTTWGRVWKVEDMSTQKFGVKLTANKFSPSSPPTAENLTLDVLRVKVFYSIE